MSAIALLDYARQLPADREDGDGDGVGRLFGRLAVHALGIREPVPSIALLNLVRADIRRAHKTLPLTFAFSPRCRFFYIHSLFYDTTTVIADRLSPIIIANSSGRIKFLVKVISCALLVSHCYRYRRSMWFI